MPKRVVFSFDDRSLESLSKMVKQGRAPGTVCPLCHSRKEEGQEVREITVQNPETGEERIIVVPANGVPAPTE